MVVVRGGMHTITVVTTDEMRGMGGTVVRSAVMGEGTLMEGEERPMGR
jgi:hypothetical protein